MTYKTATISYDARERAFWALASLLVVALGLYMYAVGATTRNAALVQNLERELSSVSAEQGALEFAYIELRNTIDLEMAYEHGFEDVRKPKYASRTETSALSLNTSNR